MATKKAKKAKAGQATSRLRPIDAEVWALPQFKALLNKRGCMTCAGLKIMVENQRDINTKLYESIETALETLVADHLPGAGKASSALSDALTKVREVPGSGPPECKTGGPEGPGDGT
jgi:hypothetical protein